MKKSLNMLVVSILMGVLFIVGIMVFIALGVAHPAPWIILAVLIAVPYITNRLESRVFVTWKPEYSVGIAVIDDDHKKLLSLINNLQASVHYHTGEAFEKQALNELVDYTRFHFQREEDMLKKYGFPGFDEHKEEHEAMIAKVGDFVAEYEAKGSDVLEGIAEYLKDWLIGHINGTDKKYSEFLIEKGES